MLLEARRTQVIDEFVDFPAKCIKEGFVEAADKAVRLKAAYVTVVGYLNEHDEPTIEQFRFLTEDAFKQGAATLNLALDLYKALKSISPKSLQTELEDTRQKLKIVTGVAGSESLQKTLTSSIETIEQRLKLFKEKQTTIDALLSKATEIESQLQNSHIELAGLGTGDPSELLNADGDAVNNLKNTLAAAKEIENQLRSQGAGQTADEQMYQQAANKPHNNN
jgi:hypothetical protein